MGYLSQALYWIMRLWLLLVLFVITLIIAAIFLSSILVKAPNKGWLAQCPKAPEIVYEIGETKLKMPSNIARQLSNPGLFQSDKYPDDVLCKSDSSPTLEVDTLVINSPQRLEVHQKLKLPGGVTQIILSSKPSEAVEKPEDRCTTWPDGKETCVVYRRFKSLPLTARYWVMTTPILETEGTVHSAQYWPYGHQPKAGWDEMHTEIEAYFESFSSDD